MKRTKVIKPLILFREGDLIDYQTVIEEIVGMWLAGTNIYDHNRENKTEINGERIDSSRAYFVSDGKYELVLNKIE